MAADARSNRHKFFLRKFKLGLAKVDVIHGIQGDEVYMRMRDFQPYHADAYTQAGNFLFDSIRNPFREQGHGRKQIIVNVKVIIHFCFWNNQGMPFNQWVDIEERQAPIIFRHNVRGDVTIDNACEYRSHALRVCCAVRHRYSAPRTPFLRQAFESLPTRLSSCPVNLFQWATSWISFPPSGLLPPRKLVYR